MYELVDKLMKTKLEFKEYDAQIKNEVRALEDRVFDEVRIEVNSARDSILSYVKAIRESETAPPISTVVKLTDFSPAKKTLLQPPK